MALEPVRRQATLGAMPMRYISLIMLALQNSLLILIMHYSRTMPAINGQRYYTSTAVFLNEVIKLAISLSLALYDLATKSEASEITTVTGLCSELAREVFTGNSWKMAIPALLCTLQNTLLYVAVSHLDVATFQVTYQLRILSEALFGVALLGRSLSLRRWLALVLLVIGVAIVSIPACATGIPAVLSVKDLQGGAAFHSPRNIWDLKALGNAAAGQLSKRSATYEGIDEDVRGVTSELDPSIGFIAVAVASVLSGLAGVYYERVFKTVNSETRSRPSLWVQNVQLAFYGAWPAFFVGLCFRDGPGIAKNGFFAGYDATVWTVIILQALGGVVVATVVHDFEPIAKSFAACISIILSCLASVAFFDFIITPSYLIGTSLVLIATYLYNTTANERPRPPPIYVSHEKGYEGAYFDLDPVKTSAKPPLRSEVLSTSRPSTPTIERRPRAKSPGLTIGKRGV